MKKSVLRKGILSLHILPLALGSLIFSACQASSSNSTEANLGAPTPPITPELIENTTPRDLEKIVDTILSTDTLAPEQWHLRNIGQRSFADRPATAGNDLSMQETLAQEIEGEGIKIAISDTGVEIDHEDLKDNIDERQCRNYALADAPYQGNPSPETASVRDAHGTMVAGIIAATAKNGLGGRGVAPKAQIVGFRYLSAPISRDRMIDQTQGDFDIFNYSYGALQCSVSNVSRDLVDALQMGTESLRHGKGAIYVKAAGNEWSGQISQCNTALKDDSHYYFGNTNFEAMNTLPYVIVVGALGSSGKIASYSTPGSSLWIMAPGGEDGTKSPAIITTDLSGCDRGGATNKSESGRLDNNPELNPHCNYTAQMRGSSAATPMVSGAVALILSVNPELSWRDVKHILASTASKPYSPPSVGLHPRGKQMPSGYTYQEGWVTNQAGFSFHNWYGFGAVNVDAAIAMAKNYKSNWGPLVATIVPTTYQSVYRKEVSLAIPEFDSKGTEDEQEVLHNLVIEAVQLELSIDSSHAQDFAVELYSPNGTKSIIINAQNGITDTNFSEEIFSTNAFYGESSLGKWKLKVVDADNNEQTGVLKSWGLRLYGHVIKSSSAEEVSAVKNIRIVSPPQNSSILESPIFGWDAPEEGEAFLRFEVQLKDETGKVVLPWMAIGKRPNIQLTTKDHRIRFFKQKKYYLSVRRIGMKENRSEENTFEWISP